MKKLTQTQLRELWTFGCDLGDRTCELFAIRPNETTFRPKAITTTRESFRKLFRNHPRAHVVLEAGTHSRWVSQELKALGHVVTVANPRKVRLIAESQQKDDRSDAELLARMGRADVALLSPIQHRGEEVQADLAVAKARDGLVRCRTRLVNQVRSLVKSFGYRLPKCDAAYFRRKTQELVPEVLQEALLPLYEALEAVDDRIKHLDKKLSKIGARYPDLELVTQISGVGVLTGLVFLLTLEDKTRFDKSRDVGAYVGLVPGKRKSGREDPQMRITKAGDDFLRRLLVQSAHYVLGPFGKDSDLRRWGLDLCKRGGKSAKKRARIAVARKLATLMHRLWVTGEIYQPLGYGRPAAAA